MTLGDKVKSIWANYIAPTKEEVKVGRKELCLVANDPGVPEQKNAPFTRKLSMVRCRNIAEQCPIFMKGANKKSMDSIRAWHHLQTFGKKDKPAEVDIKYLKAFEKRNDLRQRWYEMRMASLISGDGYLLITFENDEKTKIHEAPAKDACPWRIRILNSEKIKEIGYYPKNKEYYKTRFIEHFHYIDNKNNRDEWIHPDRILHLPSDKLYNKKFGSSKVNLLRNIIKSSVNVDIAVGEILAWFAHGTYDITQDGLDPEEKTRWEKIAKQHPGAWIHDETSKIESINPQAIDPKPFYEYLILNIAAAFRMPMHVLTGIQVGKVTGAEVGMGDYVKDVKDDQDLDYTPLLERLYTMILKAKGREWKYDIVWNPIYIDELAEAEILNKKVEAAEAAYNGKRGAGGFIDQEETRRIFNEGQIELDVSKKIKPRVLPKPPAAPKDGDDGGDDDGDDENEEKNFDLYKQQLRASAKATRAQVEKEAAKKKRLGMKILLEQDKDDRDKSQG